MDHNLPTKIWSLVARQDDNDSAQKLLDLIKDPFSGEVCRSPCPSLPQVKPLTSSFTGSILVRLGLAGIVARHHRCRRRPLLPLPPVPLRRLRPQVETCRRIPSPAAVGKGPLGLGQPALQDQGEGAGSVGRSGRGHFHALPRHVSQYVRHHDPLWVCDFDPRQLHQDD